MADLGAVQRQRRAHAFSIRRCVTNAIWVVVIEVGILAVEYHPASAEYLALGGTFGAVLAVGLSLLLAKPRTTGRIALSAPFLAGAFALSVAWVHTPPNEGYRFERDAERAVASKCPSDRRDRALAILDRWFDGNRPTTINCAPNTDIGTYGNGSQLSVTVAGRVDPACPVPRDTMFFVRGRMLVLHYCESRPSA